ncbi:N-acyl amino acid synthase FeeM domain-containing protein [Nitrosovibrio tenuis]|nr:hypothetical protein [Nitrosovibrio tenuis]
MPGELPTKKVSESISGEQYILKRGDYNIYLADSSQIRNKAVALVKRMYSWRGYDTESAAVSLHNQLTFVATRAQYIVGTVTLGLDSKGYLLADELYGREINAFREKGRKVCELSKFAIDPEHSSREIIASLFHLAYIYGRIIHNATDLFGEVNPRHARSHERMFGFRQISEMRTCPRVGAPAVLLHLELDYVGDQIASLAGSRKPGERSIYPYCSAHQKGWLANNSQNIN